MARGKYGRKYGRKSGRGFKRGRKSYGKKRYGKTRVPSGTRYVRGAMRTAGSYAVGQARAELKFCDSLLNNHFVNGDGNQDWAAQVRPSAGDNPANTNGIVLRFSSSAGVNPAGSNYAGTTGQPGMLLNNITQGADARQRIGRKIQIKSIRVRVSARINDDFITQVPVTNNVLVQYDTKSLSYAKGQSARLVLVWDKQPNGSIATSSMVFKAQNGKLGTDAMMNLDYRDRFVILADETRALAPFGTGCVHFDIYKECDLTTIFSSTVADQQISSIQSGALYAFFLGDVETVTPVLTPPIENTIRSEYNMCRLRYLDM